MFEGLGIFFDTYKNNRPGVVFPYVMAMLGDGKTPYDKANDGKANELAGCSVCLLRSSFAPFVPINPFSLPLVHKFQPHPENNPLSWRSPSY